MEINFALVVAAVVVQFVLGAVWHSPLMFGKLWMKIMNEDCEKWTKEQMDKMQKEMMPFYGLQLILTIITTFVLASNLAFGNLQGVAAQFYAFFMWLGYMMPIQVASVIWGGTKKSYWPKQIAIMIGYTFIGLQIAAYILSI